MQNNQFIPADIVLLKTSEDNGRMVIITYSKDYKGTCFIETKNLDGETNLKAKNVDKPLLTYFKDDNDVFIIMF